MNLIKKYCLEDLAYSYSLWSLLILNLNLNLFNKDIENIDNNYNNGEY